MLEFGVWLIDWLRANAVVDLAIAVGLVAVGLKVLGQRYEIGHWGTLRNQGRSPWMPVVLGRSPTMRLVRDGLQRGAWQWALFINVPRSASLSM